MKLVLLTKHDANIWENAEKMNMQMAAEHDYLNPSNKKQIL